MRFNKLQQKECMSYDEYLPQIPENIKEYSVLRLPGIKPHGKTLFGFGSAQQTGDEMKQLGGTKVIIVTDKVITSLGLHEPVQRSLVEADIQFSVYTETEPEPDISCARNVQSEINHGNYDGVIGLGGGSVLDLAKIAALTAANSEDISDYFTGKQFYKKGLPLILLPTTSGTGSEMSPFVVIKDGHVKRFMGTSVAFADTALIDPLFSVSMPKRVTAATGMDALSHGIEGVMAMSDPYNEALAIKCIELVFRYLPMAYLDGEDLAARYYMSFASVLGMMAYVQGGGLYAHSISYILTSHYDVAHGEGCALALPYTLTMCAQKIPELMKKFSQAAQTHTRVGYGDSSKGIIEGLSDMLRRIEVPLSLAEIGVERGFKDKFIAELTGAYFRERNPLLMNDEIAGILFDALYNGNVEMINQKLQITEGEI